MPGGLWPWATGGGGKPDASGIRGGGSPDRRARALDKEFPYDMGDPHYGEKNPTELPKSSSPDGVHLTPKDTEHSVWDKLDEAVGVPFNSVMGGNGGHGPTTPGVAQWANSPNDFNPLDVDATGSAPRDGVKGTPQGARQFVAGAQMGSGNSPLRSRRGLNAGLERRGAFLEAWVHLNSVPPGSTDGSMSVEDEELESLRSEFSDACARLEDILDSISDEEFARILIGLDRGHVARSLASRGRGELDSIYSAWKEPALAVSGTPGDDEDEDQA